MNKKEIIIPKYDLLLGNIIYNSSFKGKIKEIAPIGLVAFHTQKAGLQKKVEYLQNTRNGGTIFYVPSNYYENMIWICYTKTDLSEIYKRLTLKAFL